MGASRSKDWQLHNRVAAVMAHTTRYAFKGQARLAQDSGMSKAAVNRLIGGKTNPTHELVVSVTKALEKQVGRRLGTRELFSFDGTYPTASVCALVGCHGCLPDAAYDQDEHLTPAFSAAKSGGWTGDSPATDPLVPASGAGGEGPC